MDEVVVVGRFVGEGDHDPDGAPLQLLPQELIGVLADQPPTLLERDRGLRGLPVEPSESAQGVVHGVHVGQHVGLRSAEARQTELIELGLELAHVALPQCEIVQEIERTPHLCGMHLLQLYLIPVFEARGSLQDLLQILLELGELLFSFLAHGNGPSSLPPLAMKPQGDGA